MPTLKARWHFRCGRLRYVVNGRICRPQFYRGHSWQQWLQGHMANGQRPSRPVVWYGTSTRSLAKRSPGRKSGVADSKSCGRELLCLALAGKAGEFRAAATKRSICLRAGTTRGVFEWTSGKGAILVEQLNGGRRLPHGSVAAVSTRPGSTVSATRAIGPPASARDTASTFMVLTVPYLFPYSKNFAGTIFCPG